MDGMPLSTAGRDAGLLLDPEDPSSSPTTSIDRVLDSLDKLQATLDGFIQPDSAREDHAMRSLARFFEAAGAGLYVAAQPGRPMELLAAFQVPRSAPRSLQGDPADGRGLATRALQQKHLLDNRNTPWYEASQEAGWTDILLYTLPGCAARLLLAFPDRPRILPAKLSKVVLRSLAAAVCCRLASTQTDILRRETDQLHHLVASGIDFVKEGVLWLDEQSKVAACNTQAEEMLGFAAGEFIGLTVTDVLVSRTNISALVQPVLSGDSSMEGHQLTLYCRDGRPLHARLRVAPMRLPGSPAPFGAMVLFVDLQAEPMAEVEKNLREENARLESMVSLLAHEIRNPLTGILAGLDYLKPALAHDPTAIEDLGVLKGEVRRLNRLLTDALLVTRACELHLRPQQIADLLDDLLAGRHQLLVDRQITLQRQYKSSLPLVAIDRPQMEHVFENLVVNAIQAMQEGGVLAIKGEALATAEGNGYQKRPVLRIQVCDSGAGIPPEVQQRIFDPFFSTKRGGTGLGLAVARRIVGLHNGTLQVESWPGVGTIFSVLLPVEE